MRKYNIKIGYTLSFTIDARSKKEAEELAWFEYDQTRPEPEMDIKEVS